jgi:hypothetical protein
MTHYNVEVVERLSGEGKVLVANSEIASVSYSINVCLERIQIPTSSSRPRFSAMQVTVGQLTVLTGQANIGDNLDWILVLSDGRRCQCTFSNKASSGEIEFYVSGEIS